MKYLKKVHSFYLSILVVIFFISCSEVLESFTVVLDPPHNQVLDDSGFLTLKNLKTGESSSVKMEVNKSESLDLSLGDNYKISYENGEYFGNIESIIPNNYSKIYLTINKKGSFEPFFGKLPQFTLGDCYLNSDSDFFPIVDGSFYKFSFLTRDFSKNISTTLTSCSNIDGRFLISENRLVTLKNGEIFEKKLSKSYEIQSFLSTEISSGDYFLVTKTSSTPNCIRVMSNTLELIENKTCLDVYPDSGELFFHSNEIYLIDNRDLYQYKSGKFEIIQQIEEIGELFYWSGVLYFLKDNGEFFSVNILNFEKTKIAEISLSFNKVIKSDYTLFFSSSNCYKTGDLIYYYDKVDIKEISIPDYLMLCDLKLFSLDSEQSLFVNKKSCSCSGNDLTQSNFYLFTK